MPNLVKHINYTALATPDKSPVNDPQLETL